MPVCLSESGIQGFQDIIRTSLDMRDKVDCVSPFLHPKEQEGPPWAIQGTWSGQEERDNVYRDQKSLKVCVNAYKVMATLDSYQPSQTSRNLCLHIRPTTSPCLHASLWHLPIRDTPESHPNHISSGLKCWEKPYIHNVIDSFLTLDQTFSNPRSKIKQNKNFMNKQPFFWSFRKKSRFSAERI